MNLILKVTVALVALPILVSQTCIGQETPKQQDTTLTQDTLKPQYPAAILVQLRSEQNRIQALKKARLLKELAEVENDAQQVQSKMKKDFHDHFDFCPVYYFIDTNIELIKTKAFNGVLFNDDGTPVDNSIINKLRDNYVVVYYGYPADRHGSNATQSDVPSGRGLVILDDKFQQVDYVFKFDLAEVNMSKSDKQYFYSSKHFDIEYFPLARKLSIKFKRRNREKY